MEEIHEELPMQGSMLDNVSISVFSKLIKEKKLLFEWYCKFWYIS